MARSKLRNSARKAVASTAQVLKDRLPQIIPAVADSNPVDTPTELPPEVSTLASRHFDIRFRENRWAITVQLTDDPAESQWLAVTDVAPIAAQPRRLDIRVSMVHPFMVRFAQTDSEDVEALLRVAAAIAVAEVLARDSGVRKTGTVRRNVNDILRNAFSEP